MPPKSVATTLLISLLQLSQIHHAQSNTCPYEISILGTTLKGDDFECFEADVADGIMAVVSAADGPSVLENVLVWDEAVSTADDPNVLENVLVWDEDAPCGGDEESFIHYSGPSSGFTGMTAGAGDPVHTYRSAFYADGLPLPAGTAGCYAFTTKGDNGRVFMCLETWRVARAGSSCPRTHRSSPAARDKSNYVYLAVSVLPLLLWI